MCTAVYAVGTLYCRVSPPFLSPSLLFTTCYMGTSNSSAETRERARRLADQIGRWALMCLQTPSPTCCTTFDTPAHFTKCSQTVAKNTIVRTHLYLYLCSPQPYVIMATWPPIQGVSQQEATRLVVSGHQPCLHTCMVPSVQRGTHLWACKTNKMREVGYGFE